MKFEKYLLEEDQQPKTKKFKFFHDNPMGSWLEHERKKAKGGSWGSVTAGFHEPMLLPTKMVSSLPGLAGEVRHLSEPRVQDLMTQIKTQGIYDPIFINVHYDGSAKINEGNRRTLIAKTLGMKYIPVELRYFAGGELIRGIWHPDNVVKVAKTWKRPPKPERQRKPMPTFHERGRKEREERKKKEKETEKLDPETKKILKLLGY